MSGKEETPGLDGSLTVLGLPRSHWHCTFENFDWERVRPRALQEEVQRFLGRVLARDGAPHLLLTGPPGAGKSHLGVAAYRWAAKRFGTQLVTWLSVPDFCDAVKASYGGEDPDPFEAYVAARRLVVLDDLFGRELSPHEASAVLYRLINVAYQNGTAVLVTMNQPASDLSTRLPAHEVSRLLADATVIPVKVDEDYRRRQR